MTDPFEQLRRSNPAPDEGTPGPPGLAEHIIATGGAPAAVRASRPSRRTGPLIALGTAVVVLVVVGAAVLLTWGGGDAGPVAVASTTAPTTSVPDTAPAATTMPPPATTVRPVAPEASTAMPDLVGLDEASATSLLDEMGIPAEFIVQPAISTAEAGRVLFTVPEAGAFLDSDDAVIVAVGSWPGTAGGPAPWSQPPLAPDAVPALLGAEWRAADNRAWCSALYPEDEEALAPDATPRPANFAGGWAVAFDRPLGPGSRADGTDCADCGRSAYGVAGAGLPASEDDARRWPNVVEYEGGIVGWGNEGDLPDDGYVDPETGSLVAPSKLAYVVAEGQGCLYNVWSRLGEDHLLALIESLRFVAGLQAEPLVLRAEDAPQDVVAAGPAPWSADPVSPDDVPPLLAREAADAAGFECPAMTFAATGSGTEEARIRTAFAEAWGVAWDNPDGPGRYAGGDYCENCGRGAFGLTAGLESGGRYDHHPTRLEWDDGSAADYGYEIGSDNRLPADRISYTDPETGGRALPPLSAALRVAAAPECEYTVWSFLGEDHLRLLVDHLRFVAG